MIRVQVDEKFKTTQIGQAKSTRIQKIIYIRPLQLHPNSKQRTHSNDIDIDRALIMEEIDSLGSEVRSEEDKIIETLHVEGLRRLYDDSDFLPIRQSLYNVENVIAMYDDEISQSIM